MLSRSDYSNIEKQLGKDRQCSKYPVFKDVKRLWKFDYCKEETKRFKATSMFEPGHHPDSIIDEYLALVPLLWARNTGMNEEIALRFLAMNKYHIEDTLRALADRSSYEIIRLIKNMTLHDAKIEMIGFIIKLTEWTFGQWR